MTTITISDDVRRHIARHFAPPTPHSAPRTPHLPLPTPHPAPPTPHGSQFFAPSPEAFLLRALTLFPEAFRAAVPDPDGRIRLSLRFPEPVGYCALATLTDLTPEERAAVCMTERDGYPVRVLHTSRRIPTIEAQLILAPASPVPSSTPSSPSLPLKKPSTSFSLITLFPGLLAPPFPASPSETSPFWDSHLFLEPPV